MEYGLTGALVEQEYARTAFELMAREAPGLDMTDYKARVAGEYRAIVARTPGVGPAEDNMFVPTMYMAAFFIALYKAAGEHMTDALFQKLIRAAAYSPSTVKAKQGISAFTEEQIAARTKQSKWSRDHIGEYPMNWYYYFETVPGKDEYYITHKQCGICKLARQEGCAQAAKFFCATDYYTFGMQGAVLDRTKTLAYGDDECNFHLMSRERARELGFVMSPNAK
jgi:hypothetical protein